MYSMTCSRLCLYRIGHTGSLLCANLVAVFLAKVFSASNACIELCVTSRYNSRCLHDQNHARSGYGPRAHPRVMSLAMVGHVWPMVWTCLAHGLAFPAPQQMCNPWKPCITFLKPVLYNLTCKKSLSKTMHYFCNQCCTVCIERSILAMLALLLVSSLL